MPTSTDPQAPLRKRKRARTVISCTECHRRKQKCDRQQPCGNCTLRSASHLCHYESKPNATNSNSNSISSNNSPISPNDSNRSLKGGSPDSTGELSLAQVKDSTGRFGYVRGSGHTALNVLEKLDLEGGNWAKPNMELVEVSECVELHAYTKYIRQIPPRPYTQLLVKVFFSECNWIYGTLHEATFMAHLNEWFEICAAKDSPHSPVKKKILSQFPALLLQVLAIALQMLPREHHKFMGQLNLGKENFYTLSATYSSTACELASLISASSPTLPRVQQWFLRSSWLKSEGRAVEAWHALGQAIREAQEMGLHREQPRKPPNSQENIACIWNREMEKRVWVNLYVWDRFMAMILGRPTMINDRHCDVTPPLDCEIPSDLTKPPVPRGPLDPPTPFTERLLDYQLANIVNEIDEMEVKVDKPLNLDFSSIDLMHSKILSFTEFFPPALAIQNRDTSYDNHHPFLAAQTELLKASAFCLVVGLHRPFVFTRDRSKQELVKASLAILDSQTRVFQMTKEHHHTIYTLCFFTFDPAVLVAAVIITSPASLDPEIIDACMEALREGQKRLEILGQRIKLAEKGAAVLKVLISKAESAISSVQRIDGMMNRTRISSQSSTTQSDTTDTSSNSPFSTTCAQSHSSPASSVSFPGSLSHSPAMMPSQIRLHPSDNPMCKPELMSDFDWATYTNSVVPHRDLMSMDLEEFFAMPEMVAGNMDQAGHAHVQVQAHQSQQQDLYYGGGCAVEEQQIMGSPGGVQGDGFWQNLLNVQFQ
ncbi:unnamed protein product [Tuber aestivum]|uniref:Zn(2)-C6 fungal-type domain-containing protein n=1 Tax=Tuber aestivum TaxID=59557 RepID=A0A292Q011_9PEZI|nr:unnamed protein product [Tuber aestivum]